MARLKEYLKDLLHWRHLGLVILVLITIALHASVILTPNELVFDEQHYVKDARYIIANHATERPEHPPLGKLLIVAGIELFGDNALGWRFFSAVFGTLGVVFFYFICRRLKMPQDAVLIASFLLTLENLTFVQASIAMLDVYSVVLMLGAFMLYLQGQYPLSGIAVALSAFAKLSGALALPAIVLHWLLSGRKRPAWFTVSMLLAPAAFVLLMPLFDYAIYHQWLDPFDRIKNMLTLSGTLTFANASSSITSRPWTWVIIPQVLFYWYEPHYVGAISFTIWALIMPTVGYMVFRAIKRDNTSLFGLSWFASTYLFWIPANYITDRITFLYYFYPTVGAICLGLGLGLSRLLDVWRSRREGKLRWAALSAVLFYLLLHVGVFVILSPVFARWVKVLELFRPPY